MIVEWRMRSGWLIAGVAGSALLGACGPSPGDRCDKGGYLCQDASSALECRDGRWRSLPCRGPGGCKVSGSSIDCDVTQNHVDDPCAEANEGYSICAPDGLAVLECRSGVFQQTLTCSSCSPTTPLLTCVPP